MRNDTPELINITGLVGVAIDVSGSMRASLRNHGANHSSRLTSLRAAALDGRNRLRDSYPTGVRSELDLFAYAFGLVDPAPAACDLLSLLSMASLRPQVMQLPTAETARHHEPLDSYAAELRTIAAQHGRAGWDRVAQEHLNDPEKIKNLVLRLRAQPALAAELARLIPDASDAEIELAEEAIKKKRRGGFSATAYVSHPIVSARMVHSSYSDGVSPTELRRRTKSLKERLEHFARPWSESEAEEDLDRLRREVIRDLGYYLQAAGDTTLRIEEALALLDDRPDGQGTNVDQFIYGGTPMRQAMKRIDERFTRELARRPKDTPAYLFVVTDGLATDGDPLPAFERIKAQGVEVISLYVTNRDLTAPTTLPTTPGHNWDRGATLMFDAASEARPNSFMVNRLRDEGWTVEAGSRNFLQVNHSDIVRDVMNTLLSNRPPDH